MFSRLFGRRKPDALPQSNPNSVIVELFREKSNISKIFRCSETYNNYLLNFIPLAEFIGSVQRINDVSLRRARQACCAICFTIPLFFGGFFGGVGLLVSLAAANPMGGTFGYAFILMFGVPLIGALIMMNYIIKDPFSIVEGAAQQETKRYVNRNIQWTTAKNRDHYWIEIRIPVWQNQNTYNQQINNYSQQVNNYNQVANNYNQQIGNPSLYNPQFNPPYNPMANNPMAVAPAMDPPPAYSNEPEKNPEVQSKSNMNTCSNCGTQNTASAKFCGTCGQHLIYEKA